MKKVLIVDDEPTIVTIIEDLLRSNGYDTLPAGSAEEAEEVMKRNLPDLILLDVMMPKTDGFEFCKKLKSDPAYQNIPVIFVTVMKSKEDIEKGKELGAADYIPKPFDPADLMARVKKHLAS